MISNRHSDVEDTRAALELLRENSVPFLLLNQAGRCVNSKQKLVNDIVFDGAEFLAKDQIVPAYAPFDKLSHLKEKRILTTGNENNVKAMQEQGFSDVITLDEYFALYPYLCKRAVRG